MREESFILSCRHLLGTHILPEVFDSTTCETKVSVCFFSAPKVWLHAPYELHLSLFEHFIELLTESRQVSKDIYIYNFFFFSVALKKTL